MKFGGAMFFTDYSMSAMELARALEERGFESVWAPEHSHIPLSRKTPFPGGGDLPKQYYDAMDPFVVLAAASQVTRTIKLGTGVLLVQQRDTIQTAKLVASIDQVSQGRFLFGIGGGAILVPVFYECFRLAGAAVEPGMGDRGRRDEIVAKRLEAREQIDQSPVGGAGERN